MKLSDAFLTTPFAHRGLHDAGAGVIENSATSFERAIAGGYGIELDLQLSRDGQAMVFHDYDMRRLTGQRGPIQQLDADMLNRIELTGSADVIHDLPTILKQIDGRAPLLIELKDQDGDMGQNIGELEDKTARALSAYDGAVALMSFNPHSVARMAQLCPAIPRGIVTGSYGDDWPLKRKTREHLRDIPDFDRVGACFVSHEADDLQSTRVADLKANGTNILCWTIKSQAEADVALLIADNITFEGFTPS